MIRREYKVGHACLLSNAGLLYDDEAFFLFIESAIVAIVTLDIILIVTGGSVVDCVCRSLSFY